MDGIYLFLEKSRLYCEAAFFISTNSQAVYFFTSVITLLNP